MKIFLLGFILILGYGCDKSEKPDIVGMWQSLNGYTVLEFTDNNVDLFRDGKPFWSIAAKEGKLNYTLKEIDKDWYQLRIMDGKKHFVNCKIEIVNKDRIRVYYFKHHGILDLADEYHRTKDFDSFKQIMKKIMNEPDSTFWAKYY
jgi:hypothetical protein